MSKNIQHFISPIEINTNHLSKKRNNIQFTVASKEYQKKRQIRSRKQLKTLNNLSHDELKGSLIRCKLIKPHSKAPKHILQNIASGLFIDDLN